MSLTIQRNYSIKQNPSFGAIKYPISHWRVNNPKIKEIEEEARKKFGHVSFVEGCGEDDTIITEYFRDNFKTIENFVAEKLKELGLKVEKV